MGNKADEPVVVQKRNDTSGPPRAGGSRVAEPRWFLDALEDDDVREALKGDRSPSSGSRGA
jgi:hypothetical protein